MISAVRSMTTLILIEENHFQLLQKVRIMATSPPHQLLQHLGFAQKSSRHTEAGTTRIGLVWTNIGIEAVTVRCE